MFKEASNSEYSSNTAAENDSSTIVHYAAIQQETKISRRQLLHKLQGSESKSSSDDERLESRASSKASVKRGRQFNERTDDDIERESASSRAGRLIQSFLVQYTSIKK